MQGCVLAPLNDLGESAGRKAEAAVTEVSVSWSRAISNSHSPQIDRWVGADPASGRSPFRPARRNVDFGYRLSLGRRIPIQSEESA